MEIELTKAADKELTRLATLTGFSRKDIIQKSFNLFRAYVGGRKNGDEWVVLPSTSVDDLSGFDRIVIPGLKL